jgi:Holliday junction resolvase-like predicted endonuclease
MAKEVSGKSQGNQWRIAEKVLQKFLTPHKTEIEGKEYTLWQVDISKLNVAMEELVRMTGKGNEIDPFVTPDGNAWVLVSSFLETIQQYDFALQFTLKYVEECYSLQIKHDERIHKGAAHFWASHYFYLNDVLEYAQSHMVLAFLEDVIEYGDAKKAPAWSFLTTKLGFSRVGLDRLDAFLKSIPQKERRHLLFPEDAILKYIAEEKRRVPWLVFPFNRLYLKHKCDVLLQGRQGRTGITLELIVYYLLKTLDNIDVRWRVPTRAGEIDLVAVNSGPLQEPARWFGDYIAVECKDRAARVKTNEVEAFFTKLSVAKMQIGLIVSRNGLTGRTAKDDARGLTHTLFSMASVAIIHMSLEEICTIDSSREFIERLDKKYEEIRLSMT